MKTDYPDDYLEPLLIEEFSQDPRAVKGKLPQELRTILSSMKISHEKWDYLVADPIAHETPKVNAIEKIYQDSKNLSNNDISGHYQLIESFSEGNVIDVSRRAYSAIPALYSKPESFKRYLYAGPKPKLGLDFTDITGKSFSDSLSDIKSCDTLIIQPPHQCPDFEKQLSDIESRVSKVLIIKESNEANRPNVTAAIKKIVNSGDWFVSGYTPLQWGCTVLTRKEPEKKVSAWIVREGVGKELVRALHKIAKPD